MSSIINAFTTGHIHHLMIEIDNLGHCQQCGQHAKDCFCDGSHSTGYNYLMLEQQLESRKSEYYQVDTTQMSQDLHDYNDDRGRDAIEELELDQ